MLDVILEQIGVVCTSIYRDLHQQHSRCAIAKLASVLVTRIGRL